MWAQERHRRIEGLVRSHRQISTETLMRELAVSRETVRRDLLRRVHGGVVLAEQDSGAEAPFARRMTQNRREKQAIARAALELIRPGQSCFVDAGSTTAYFAAELGKMAGIQTVTNSLEVAGALNRLQPGNETLLLGGRLISDVPGTYGELTLSEIGRFHPDLAFLGPVGVDPAGGVTDFALHEAEVARLMAAQARRVVILADAGKLGVVSRVQICPTDRVATLVTDRRAKPAALTPLRQAGIGNIVVAR